MSSSAYLYFQTPDVTAVGLLLQHLDSSICISHFGVKDPPKRRNGSVDAMALELLQQQEQNKWAFVRDIESKVGLDIQLNYDPRWSHSTISLTGATAEKVKSLASRLAELINPYLCIHGSTGAGKTQQWSVLFERSDCPSDIKECVRAA